RKPGRKTGLFVFAFKKNPVPKGAGFFAVWGISPPGGAALTGATKAYPGQSAQHRLRRKLRHVRSIISFQRKIKPRHGNPFAIIHFFPAPALAMIAKTVLAKKNVNPITYKNITII
ncbi:TPA: hypothetical protein ACR6X8_005098, partial [Klebsiella pneumoniae]|uniref:hypothetical protein n=10 Tax=Klebsiella pneumoniae TaxID=573 RepID=UPI001B8A98C3